MYYGMSNWSVRALFDDHHELASHEIFRKLSENFWKTDKL